VVTKRVAGMMVGQQNTMMMQMTREIVYGGLMVKKLLSGRIVQKTVARKLMVGQ
jgi:hypothetical protein